MRGLFAKLLAWFLASLLFSAGAFFFSSFVFAPGKMQRDQFFHRIVDFEFEDATRAYESGGPRALGVYLDRLNSLVTNQYYLLDAQGADLRNGAVRKDLLVVKSPSRWRILPPRSFRIKQISKDGRYVFVIDVSVHYDPTWDILSFGWIIAVVVLLVYALAFTLVRPIGRMREAVKSFGQGDLSARARLKRKDEIGELGAAFDEMAERIETLLAAERRLLQDVSHELRSPLARLSFALELVRKNPSSDEAFQRVKKEVRRISLLIGDLLQVTRVEGDAGSRNDESIAIGPFLSEVVEDCELEAQARDCRIELRDEGVGEFRGDRELLRRAVENVLRNSIRYTPPGQSVDVTASHAGNDLLMTIRDYGPGVPETELEAIFRPFHRVEEDRNRASGGGVGLGLSIAYRAVLLHHGSISASNAQPGLSIQIRLPG
jgi:two-component system sensor histidine kinase CpxA